MFFHVIIFFQIELIIIDGITVLFRLDSLKASKMAPKIGVKLSKYAKKYNKAVFIIILIQILLTNYPPKPDSF